MLTDARMSDTSTKAGISTTLSDAGGALIKDTSEIRTPWLIRTFD